MKERFFDRKVIEIGDSLGITIPSNIVSPLNKNRANYT